MTIFGLKRKVATNDQVDVMLALQREAQALNASAVKLSRLLDAIEAEELRELEEVRNRERRER